MTWKTSAFVESLKKPVLVVGAGGIGCELLKNLALTGFTKIHVVDLDTIDISNLNRQFLFRKEHVGKSKAEVATAAVKTMTPEIDITFDHGSITSEKYDVDFFKGFTFVFNALDNKAARAHVNRLCLAADIPLFESGSAGYKGNVFVIMKGKTECFECLGKPVQKTFPGENGNANGNTENGEEKKPVGPSLRMIASQAGYDSKEVFNKLYDKDINYLLTMEDLWKDRRPPNPLSWEGNSAAGTETITNKIWPIQTWEGIFTEAVEKLKKNFKEAEAKGNVLVWDKDDDVAMNFVSAAANIRAHIFHIPMKSTFDIKSMAGNIIPAIATTNAVVAGMIVVEAIRVIRGGAADLRAAYTNPVPIASRLVSSSAANPPNPKCFVCGGGNTEVKIAVNLEAMKVSTFEEQVLKKGLSVIEPDIIDLGTNNVIISSDGDTDGTKTLYAVGVRNGTRLDCDDFKQDFSVKIQVQHEPSFDAVQFELREDEPMKEEAKETTQNETGLIKESMEIDEVSHMKNLKRAASTKIDENIELPTKKQKISN
uniref:SUMO-activating enzyme subunit n=1 Tax=Panagrolaimus sp. PS1159 TaxID=55785 RepID=A0AC35GUA7_9BILA